VEADEQDALPTAKSVRRALWPICCSAGAWVGAARRSRA